MKKNWLLIGIIIVLFSFNVLTAVLFVQLKMDLKERGIVGGGTSWFGLSESGISQQFADLRTQIKEYKINLMETNNAIYDIKDYLKVEKKLAPRDDS